MKTWIIELRNNKTIEKHDPILQTWLLDAKKTSRAKAIAYAREMAKFVDYVRVVEPIANSTHIIRKNDVQPRL